MDSDEDQSAASVSDATLAELQAGLLDDATAARIRRLVRADLAVAHRLAALDRVRGELARLGTDAASAPDVPAEVTDRIGAALRTAPPPPGPGSTGARDHPAHSIRSAAAPRLQRWQLAALVIGLSAAVVAAGLGVLQLVRAPDRAPSADLAFDRMTVPAPRPDLPLSDAQVRALLTVPADLGPLTDPPRRAACLGALGYPDLATPVLGARPLDVDGRSGVLLLLPDARTGADPPAIVAVVVAPRCGSGDAALLTDRRVLSR